MSPSQAKAAYAAAKDETAKKAISEMEKQARLYGKGPASARASDLEKFAAFLKQQASPAAPVAAVKQASPTAPPPAPSRPAATAKPLPSVQSSPPAPPPRIPIGLNPKFAFARLALIDEEIEADKNASLMTVMARARARCPELFSEK